MEFGPLKILILLYLGAVVSWAVYVPATIRIGGLVPVTGLPAGPEVTITESTSNYFRDKQFFN